MFCTHGVAVPDLDGKGHFFIIRGHITGLAAINKDTADMAESPLDNLDNPSLWPVAGTGN